MKKLKDLLLLGNPLLYETSIPVTESDMSALPEWIGDLDNVMSEVRRKYNFGRAIAAPQLGIMKRLIYVNIDKPVIIINPEIINAGKETFELWDDCMSLPNLLVKVKRYKSITMKYLDENRQEHIWNATGDISELLQHEYDHLDGILCTMRAIDEKSFRWRINED